MFSDVKSLARIRAQAATMRSIAAWPEEKLMGPRAGVSGWSPYEHVDHSAKVVSAILTGLLQPDLPQIAPVSLLGHAVLITGYIPRGKAKAPSRVRPVLGSVAELHATLDALDQLIGRIADPAWTRPMGAVIPHPYFGGMTATQSLRFVGIHTNHHLKIVREMGS